MGVIEYMRFSEKEYKQRIEKARELITAIFHIVDLMLCLFRATENQLQ